LKLHILSRPASSHSDLLSAVRFSPGAVLLIEDAVFTASKGSPGHEMLRRLMDAGAPVYALKEDLESRGLRAGLLLEGVRTVDYEGFVELVEKHEVVPWL
jgi:tRNA 2-thiouridine synthesizing protein B